MVEKKGFAYLLDAIRQLKRKGYSIRLSVIGEGEEREKLSGYCRQHALEQCVYFAGWQTPEQIRQWYAGCDLFVLPSVITGTDDRDGIPNVILEAMAAGVPVISTSVSGIPEVIRHLHNGLLVPEKDSNRLTQAISGLINDASLRIRLAENARRTVEEKFEHKQCNASLLQRFHDSMID
jgi:glycosyltransferase involved in cell wall biosynthesis